MAAVPPPATRPKEASYRLGVTGSTCSCHAERHPGQHRTNTRPKPFRIFAANPSSRKMQLKFKFPGLI